MTEHIQIKNIPPRIQYIADGILNTFEFPFAIFKSENMRVYYNSTLQEENSYTVSFNSQTSGGTVTFITPPPKGCIVTLFRNLDIERTTDFQEGGALRASALNYELDYQIACQQQIADNLNRSMVLPPYATDTNVDLTLPAPSAGKAIVWNKNGTNLENSNIEINELETSIRQYKEAAKEASNIATQKADIATEKAEIASNKAAEAIETFSSKANIDMDNLSSNGKSTICLYMTPDYENPTVYNGSLSSGSNIITITKSSYIVALTPQVGSTSGYIYIKTQSGKLIEMQYTDGGSAKQLSVSAILEPASYDITVTGSGGTYHIYPLKGAL